MQIKLIDDQERDLKADQNKTITVKPLQWLLEEPE